MVNLANKGSHRTIILYDKMVPDTAADKAEEAGLPPGTLGRLGHLAVKQYR
jgi:hypothetical protein